MDVYFAPLYTPNSREQHVHALKRVEQSHQRARAMELRVAARVAHLLESWSLTHE